MDRVGLGKGGGTEVSAVGAAQRPLARGFGSGRAQESCFVVRARKGGTSGL